jgi:ornithine carbamoyltransferase
MAQDYLSVTDLTAVQTLEVFALAQRLKRDRLTAPTMQPLAGKTVATIFEKPSLRTRVSFDVGVKELGGHPMYLGPEEIGLGKREAVRDVGRVLGSYVHVIVARVYRHTYLEEMARATTTPIINALSDREHPCQALADLFTLWERKGQLRGLQIAFVGDRGNNVATSLMLLAARLGVGVTLIGPPGFEPPKESVAQARSEPDARITIAPNLAEADLSYIDALYADVWVSMGQEHEAEERKVSLAPYRVDGALLARTRPDTLLLHCLPAKRGEEITDDVLDGPQSAVWDQAENRLHTQKALLAWMFGER